MIDNTAKIKPAMKKRIDYFGPLLVGIAGFIFYIILYTPAMGSADFVTAVLVFWACMGWSAAIIFKSGLAESRRFIFFLHLGIAVICPFITVFLMKSADPLWHMVTVGIDLSGLTGLTLFVAAHYKRKQKTGQKKEQLA